MGTVVGNSMYPMLRSRRDTIVVRPCTGRLRQYDVALYIGEENMCCIECWRSGRKIM